MLGEAVQQGGELMVTKAAASLIQCHVIAGLCELREERSKRMSGFLVVRVVGNGVGIWMVSEKRMRLENKSIGEWS